MDFWRFSLEGLDPTSLIEGSYDIRLVFLSFVVAAAASYATLQIVERVGDAKTPRVGTLWLAAGSLCMGCGVWAMHFVGMLSFQLPLPMEYDLPLTLLSVVPAIAGAAVMIRVLARGTPSPATLHGAGLAMGLGIGTMHYLGMEAMRVSAVLRYHPALFAVSILVAYVLATTAFWAESVLDRRATADPAAALMPSAAILGAAVCGMHYTAMGAVELYADPGAALVSGMLFSPFALSVATLTVTSSVAAIAVGGTIVDRRLQRALTDVEQLKALLPICAWCKKISDEQGGWQELEAYIANRARAEITHGICPTCSVTHFGEG